VAELEDVVVCAHNLVRGWIVYGFSESEGTCHVC
jgi:hypothetical protein